MSTKKQLNLLTGTANLIDIEWKCDLAKFTLISRHTFEPVRQSCLVIIFVRFVSLCVCVSVCLWQFQKPHPKRVPIKSKHTRSVQRHLDDVPKVSQSLSPESWVQGPHGQDL